MTPRVGWSAVGLNGLKFLVVISPAATVTVVSLPAGCWPAEPEQAASASAPAVAAAAAASRRRVLVRFLGFRSIDRFLSGHGPRTGGLRAHHPAPPGKLAVT